MKYRRKKGMDTWHWCSHCNGWPTHDYDLLLSKPAVGKFCKTCLELVNKKNCN